MNSQVRFAMHPADERDFERLLVNDESIRFIAGPRWKTETPITSRSLTDIDDDYCIIWSTSDIAKLKAEYIPTCDDWYCRSEYATIQFLRSEIDEQGDYRRAHRGLYNFQARFSGFKRQEPGEAIQQPAKILPEELLELDNPMA